MVSKYILIISIIFSTLSISFIFAKNNKIIKEYLDNVEQGRKNEIVKEENIELNKQDSYPVKILSAKSIPNRGWDIKDYRIEKDDVLEIFVWQAEELKQTVVVRPDGKISFPLIGDILAEGKSVEEVRKDITEKISKYVRNPQVSVIIKEFGGKRATIIKEIGGGGVIRFTSPITIIEAIGMGGGYHTDINFKNVFVIRAPEKGENFVKIIVVNVQDILRKGDLRENIYLHSEDIIFLPRGGFATAKYVKDELLKLITLSFTYTPSTGSRWSKLNIVLPDQQN